MSSILYTTAPSSYDIAVVKAAVTSALYPRVEDVGVQEGGLNLWVRVSSLNPSDQAVFNSVVYATSGQSLPAGSGGGASLPTDGQVGELLRSTGVGSQEWTDVLKVSTGMIQIASAAAPFLQFYDTGGATDLKYVQMIMDGGDVVIRNIDDDQTTGPTDLLKITNAGSVIALLGTLYSLSTGNAFLVLDAGQGATAGNQVAYIDFNLDSVLKGNIAVNEATAGTPLELNSSASTDVQVGAGGGNLVVVNSLEVGGTAVDALASGVYTPTLTNTTNLAASTAYECQYMRVGATVTVSGHVDVDPTTTGSTILGISLPVASNFGAVDDCGGAAFAAGVAGQGAAIFADAANDRGTMQWIAVDTANRGMFFSFTYQVI